MSMAGDVERPGEEPDPPAQGRKSGNHRIAPPEPADATGVDT
jgi:hypothetical protein